MEVYERIKKWFADRCWHDLEYSHCYPKKLQNDYFRPVIVEVWDCKKCGGSILRSFFKDVYKPRV